MARETAFAGPLGVAASGNNTAGRLVVASAGARAATFPAPLVPPILVPPMRRRRSRLKEAAGLVPRVLIYGTGEKALRTRQALLESGSSVEIVGFYASPQETLGRLAGVAVFGGAISLVETVRALDADEIVIAVADRRGGVLPLRELLDCKLGGVRVYDTASYFEHRLGQIPIDSVNASWLIFGRGFRQDLIRNCVKRSFDVVSSLALLCLSLPIMALTALFIACEGGGPVFYRQQRVGRNNRPFHVLKFRSMRTDAESDGRPKWAAANDPRITRIGRLIRRLRIDELPQLVSVLRGEMSLVGPRPERPYFVEQLTGQVPFYAVRHSVKPGLTGWAQVRYHYGACKEDCVRKLQYDLYYIKNHSLLLDLKILFATVGVVLSGKGAQ